MITRLAIFVVVLSALAGLGAAVSWFASSNAMNNDSAVFAGTRVHDFGVMTLSEDAPLELSHTFELVNTLDHDVAVGSITSTCGCTVAEADRSTVAPGAALRIHAGLELTSSGRRASYITVNLGADGVLMLEVSASGRRLRDFHALQSTVRIREAQPASITLVASDIESDRAPDTPDVELPPGFVVTRSPWTCLQKRSVEQDRPARWSCVLTIERAHGTALSGNHADTIVVRLGQRESIEIPLLRTE